MRLSGIKLAGFKSFVDSAYLPLPSNLSSVVGPNGCGKSNIIDAVRWVLGETSMRTLRSESMEDVIFNGSKARKPVGKASVELLFDNSDGTIAGPYAAYNEISVRRELTRDGNSQYLLNGRKCKKRDVTDLFLGTGLGLKSGYAIIEQGMVSRMVEAKPDELRHWLEEAAGISRYKERRRETESRIRQTRENLDRLNDLRAELQARLNALQRQARNAEKYKEYKASERRLRGELLVLRWRELSRECAAHEAQIQAYDAQLKAEREKVTAAQSAQESAERENRDANHRLSEEQTRVYEAEAALARHEQSLKHARELRNLKRQELAQLQQQLDALDASEKAGRDRLAAPRLPSSGDPKRRCQPSYRRPPPRLRSRAWIGTGRRLTSSRTTASSRTRLERAVRRLLQTECASFSSPVSARDRASRTRRCSSSSTRAKEPAVPAK